MVAVAMMVLSAMAQQTVMTVNDEERHQTITVTAVGDDIVRVDVVPEGWNGTRLPSLAGAPESFCRTVGLSHPVSWSRGIPRADWRIHQQPTP